jgi:SAM-dependent methyltransferase
MKSPQIDWNEVWKCKYDRVKSQYPKKKKNFWDSKENALEYLKESKKHTEETEQIIQFLPLSPELRVLEIGSGPGNMAIPISKHVAHVNAIEPGKGMMEVLREQISEHGATNMTAVQKRWEDVDIARDLDGQYDLVIASHGLGISDMQAAIKKMCAASRKWVYLYDGAGISTWEQRMIDLWPALHGREYYQGPRADVLYNLLYNMGIYPNVKSEPRDTIRIYPDLDTVISKFRESFQVSTPEQERIMRDYLKEIFKKTENGYFDRIKWNTVTFWWDISGN